MKNFISNLFNLLKPKGVFCPEPNREAHIDVSNKIRLENGTEVIQNRDRHLVNAHEHTGIIVSSMWDWPNWEYKVKFEGNRVAFFWDYEIIEYVKTI